jgi:hypothetical protein
VNNSSTVHVNPSYSCRIHMHTYAYTSQIPGRSRGDSLVQVLARSAVCIFFTRSDYYSKPHIRTVATVSMLHCCTVEQQAVAPAMTCKHTFIMTTRVAGLYTLVTHAIHLSSSRSCQYDATPTCTLKAHSQYASTKKIKLWYLCCACLLALCESCCE